jgi:hypothetical protein
MNGATVLLVNNIIAFYCYPNINSIESSENYIRVGIDAASINFIISVAVILPVYSNGELSKFLNNSKDSLGYP